jgi:hypothetical protein
VLHADGPAAVVLPHHREQWEKPGTVSKVGVTGEALKVLASLKQLQHLDLWLHARAEPQGEWGHCAGHLLGTSSDTIC